MMNRILIVLFLAAGCAHAPASGGHTQCDDVDQLAGEWHKLANYIHEHNDNGLDADEIKHVAGEEHHLMPPTHSLIDEAASTGGPYSHSAKNMVGVLNELDAIDDDDDWSEDVKVIDKLVGEIDEVTHECDFQSTHA